VPSLQVEPLRIGALAGTEFLRLALQLSKARFHECNGAFRLDGAFFVDRSISALNVLNVPVTFMVQWSQMRQILLELLNNWDDINEASDSLIRFSRISVPAPLGPLPIDKLYFIGVMLASYNN